MAKKNLKIALIGNPNSGKSTLFNAITGLNQKVANFAGVTVDKKIGFAQLTNTETNEVINAEIIDLPGTYSLYPKSPDERIPFQVLCDPKDESHPELTIVTVDGSNLKRSMLLCSQVIDLKSPVILALNMMDMVRKKGLEIDIKLLSEKLGVKIIACNARTNEGIEDLKKAITEYVPVPQHDFIPIRELAPDVVDEIKAAVNVKSDYAAFQSANSYNEISYFHFNKEKQERVRTIIEKHGFSSKKLQGQETLDRYTTITELLALTVKNTNENLKKTITNKLDSLLTHRIWGYLFFLVILFTMFQAIFSWSAYPMDWVEKGFLWLGNIITTSLPTGVLTDLLVNGVLAGLSGIAVFVPQIALLFMFIAILEDSGYMARVSFIMDKLMRKFGLNGKSVIPLISGVACAVPAIMSTRTIQNKKERLITIMVTPLMSCSARIPVYTLLISMSVPNKLVFSVINLQGLVLMGFYLLGFLAAIGSAKVMQLIVKAKERSYFIMEMPEYRMPRWKNIGITIFEKVKMFLFDAGKIIITISIILWVLSSYGPDDHFKKIEEKYALEKAEKRISAQEANQHIQSEKLAASYAGIMGKKLEPIIKPLGFDWKIGIALVTSFAAREVFVGTMSTIYSVGENNENRTTVREKMAADRNPDTGLPVYTLATGLSLMIFYAFAMQCMSTLAVVHRETKSWKWPAIQMLYMSGLAYLSSLLVYQLFK
jgi:ferrous iron transport protein B